MFLDIFLVFFLLLYTGLAILAYPRVDIDKKKRYF